MTEGLATVADPLLDLVVFACAAVVGLCIALLALELRAQLTRFEGELFTVRVRTARASPESLFMSLHGLRRSALRGIANGQPWVGLELAGRAGQVGLGIWIPKGEEAFMRVLLQAVYPGMELERASPGADTAHYAVGEFALLRGNYLPIRTLFDEEPLAGVVSALVRARAEARLQLLVRPKPSRWRTAAYGSAQRLRDGRGTAWWPRLGVPADARATQFERERAKAIESKAAGLGFDCVLRVIVAAGSHHEARAMVRSVAAGLLPFTDANAFVLRKVRAGRRPAPRYPERFPLGSALLTAKELAALWHAPDEGLLERLGAASRAIAPGADRSERRIGVATSNGGSIPVGLSVVDSRFHLHLLGSTGTGKTTALLSLAAQDIAAGRGVAVLDPKGDLVRGLLERIPKARIDDVVLISPEDGTTSVGINPLEVWPGDDGDLVAENALTIFKRIYERYWGPRTDDILKSALLTLLHVKGATLAHIPILLTDSEYRRVVLKELDDPLGLEPFWRWFEGLSDAQRRESIGPLLNKLRDFLIRPRLRRLLCQPRSTVDLRSVVDGGGILLADLSVGRWGETTAALIGSFLVARLWQSVLARSAIPEDARRDFFLFLDEFQHFLGIAGPFSDALAEARSLRLSLTLANQHLGQLTRELRDAVTSNARSRIVFQCGQDDAAYLGREFAPMDAAALMSLERFEAAARLVVDGRTSRPFALRTLPPVDTADAASVEQVRAASARAFGRAVGKVDAELEASIPSEALGEGERNYRLSKAKPEPVSRKATRELRAGSARVTQDVPDPEEIGRNDW